MNLSSLRNYPVTLIIAAIALVVHAVPTLAGMLQVDYAGIVDGQWWRLVTGHLTHFDTSHLFWDLMMFVALGAACERYHPRLYALALTLMAVGISGTIWLVCPDITIYRGLSGIDTGLFVWLALIQIRQAFVQRDRFMATIWLLPCIGLIGKLIFEAFTGQTLFVDSSGFTPLVQSHLVGAAIGAVLGIRKQPRESRRARTKSPCSRPSLIRAAHSSPAEVAIN